MVNSRGRGQARKAGRSSVKKSGTSKESGRAIGRNYRKELINDPISEEAPIRAKMTTLIPSIVIPRSDTALIGLEGVVIVTFDLLNGLDIGVPMCDVAVKMYDASQ